MTEGAYGNCAIARDCPEKGWHLHYFGQMRVFPMCCLGWNSQAGQADTMMGTKTAFIRILV
jgi:hypothetical protein